MMYRFGFVAGLALLVLAGAANGLDKADEDLSGLSARQAAALEERVRARWQSKSDRDFGRTWEFSTPNFREVFPKSLYVQKFSYMVEWQLTGVRVVAYDAGAAVASVAARVMTKPAKQTSIASDAIGDVPVTIREKWILIDGEWWHSTND
jgi:hypothetical protein